MGDILRFEPEDEESIARRAFAAAAGNDADSAEVESLGPRKAMAALKMALHGATDAEIAHQLNYRTAAAAHLAWERALARSSIPLGSLEAARNKSLAQLNEMLASLAYRALNDEIEIPDANDPWAKKIMGVNTEHLAYSKMFLAVLDRIIRLQGLDAPQRIELRTPQAEELQRVVDSLKSLTQQARPLEGDIFAEVVEDEEDDDGQQTVG